MRAFAVRGFGEAPAIHDLPLPTADGAPVIRVTYAGVNPIDYKLVDQLTPQSTYPFVIGNRLRRCHRTWRPRLRHGMSALTNAL
jgi:NADPH:quinone reductase-like Zn-dependent oxidoreductase